MPLTSTDLSELVRALRSNPENGDKRAKPRVGMRAKADINIEGQTVPVWVRNVSAGGVNLSCPQPIDTGTRFELLLSKEDKIGCIACYCRPNTTKLFAIGARFTQDVKRRGPV